MDYGGIQNMRAPAKTEYAMKIRKESMSEMKVDSSAEVGRHSQLGGNYHISKSKTNKKRRYPELKYPLRNLKELSESNGV